MRSSTLLAAAAIACAAASPTAAQAADRAGARKVARATAELRSAVHAEKGAIERATHRLNEPICARALDGVPAGQRGIDAAQYVFDYGTLALFEPIKQELAAFSARLDRIDLRDRRLHSGRAAQRRLASYSQPLPPAPTDACERLDAWRAAGYPEGQAPRIDDPATYPFAVVSVRDSVPIQRAGERLRRLGVAPRLYRLWTGELGGLFAGIDISPVTRPVG